MTNARGANASEGIFAGGSEVVKDLVELVNVARSKINAESDDCGFAVTHSRPLKTGLLPRSSARIHPMDQTSMAVVCSNGSR